MSLYYLGNARNPTQHEEMRQLQADGVCIFCPEHLGASRRVVHQSTHWTVTPNDYPYRGTQIHYLLVPDEHVDDMTKLSPGAQQDFWTALAWVTKGLTYYGIAIRNGDSRYTGGTIEHVHVHVLQGDPDDEPVRVKFSSRPQ
jgi:diadenosine tetraphosphate (Ap4A) HIT family hydrolase